MPHGDARRGCPRGDIRSQPCLCVIDARRKGRSMIEIARVTRSSTAPGSRFFERWCDLPSHPEWAPSMEYFVLDEPFRLGATGRSRAVGGAETRFTVTRVGPGWVYADTTDLDGVRLTVLHEAVDGEHGTVITLTVAVEIARNVPDRPVRRQFAQSRAFSAAVSGGRRRPSSRRWAWPLPRPVPTSR